MKRNLFLISALAAFAFAARPAHAEEGHDEPSQPAGEHAPSVAHGEAAPHGGSVEDEHGGHHKRSVSDVVFSHVSNERELEFENPVTGDEAKVHLPQFKQAFGIPWLDLSITKHLVWMWIGSALLILIFLLARPRTTTPRGGALVLEMLVLFVRDELAKVNIPGEEHKRFVPYLCTAFFFILTLNLLGLVPYTATATGNLGVTAGLAILTFVLTQYAAIRSAGIGGYLAHLTGGTPPPLWPIMIPVEVLGLFTKPFALAVRLFANMIAGHVVIYFLLGLIFILRSHFVAVVSVPFSIAVYMLEIFVAFLQAYVFTMLSATFIGMAVASGHHDHDAHHAAEGGHAAQH